MKRCKDCKWWREGKCHKNAPVTQLVITKVLHKTAYNTSGKHPFDEYIYETPVLWPKTKEADGCGEWRPK